MDGAAMSMVVLSVAFPFAPVGPGAAGGAEQVLWLMDRRLSERGDRSVVIACAGSGSNAVLHAIPIPDHPWGPAERQEVYRRWRSEIRRVVHKLRPDVLHMHGIDFAEYLTEGLSDEVRTFVTLHLPVDWYPPGAIGKPGIVHVCVSHAQAAAMKGAGPAPVIPNGIDVASYDPGRSRAGYAAVLGRICPEKGIHLAIEAARSADVPLKIAGQVFPYEAHVRYFEEQIVPRLGGPIEYLGPLGPDGKRELLGRARCLLIPSLAEETSSLVAMEAAASGCPVIAFRRGALPEVVEQGITGFIVEDASSMARAIHEAAPLDPRMTRARAVERFGYRTMVDAYRRLFGRGAT